MNEDQAALARKQLERRFAPLRETSFAVPPRGWIKAIREALGMTVRQLAARMGTSISRIPVIEKAEVSGSTTIKTLRQAAEAFMPSYRRSRLMISCATARSRKRARILRGWTIPCGWKIRPCSKPISTKNSGA